MCYIHAYGNIGIYQTHRSGEILSEPRRCTRKPAPSTPSTPTPSTTTPSYLTAASSNKGYADQDLYRVYVDRQGAITPATSNLPPHITAKWKFFQETAILLCSRHRQSSFHCNGDEEQSCHRLGDALALAPHTSLYNQPRERNRSSIVLDDVLVKIVCVTLHLLVSTHQSNNVRRRRPYRVTAL